MVVFHVNRPVFALIARRQTFGISREGSRQDLDCHVATQLLIARSIHRQNWRAVRDDFRNWAFNAA